ncbi:ribulose-phosphate 3-epimerase [Verrucomicrobiota bacterium]|nr:ribulose-phosphate 3-epimerase [Verrucomicrobiota bacterium]
MPTPVVAPSLLAATTANSSLGLRAIEEAGLTWVHLDIMDGHFVPNISFGPQVVADLRPRTKLHFDVHLMLTHPDRFVLRLRKRAPSDSPCISKLSTTWARRWRRLKPPDSRRVSR